MTSESNFSQLLEELKIYYDKLDEDNKNKLKETIQMILTKFGNRL